MSPPSHGSNGTNETKTAILRALTSIPDVLKDLDLLKGSAPSSSGGPGSRLICCPFHGDKTPSCSVSIGREGTLRAKCFACNEAGDVFKLIAVVHGLDPRNDFPKIVGIAADMAGIPLEGREPARLPLPPPRPLAPSEVRTPVTLEEEVAYGSAVAHLCRTFPITSDERVTSGLAGRFLLETALREGWGVLPRADAHRVLRRPEYDALATTFFRQGTLRWADHRLVIPWRCPDGSIWSFQRRFAPKTGNEDPKREGLPKVPKYVWPPNDAYVPRFLWPYGSDHHTLTDPAVEEVWVVEGAPDALSLRLLNDEGALSKDGSARTMAAVGIPGTSALTSYLPALRLLVAGKRVVVGVDNDGAGQKVQEAWVLAMQEAGASAVRVANPRDKDWNLLLRSLR